MEIVKSQKLDRIYESIDIKDPELKKIFQYCLRSIWESALSPHADGSVYVSCLDKRLMSLRESTALMLPYCLLSRDDAALQVTLRGVIDTQLQMILTDPYANRFAFRGNGSVKTSEPVVNQRHFTLDSLLSPVQLLWSYWQSTEDDLIFDETTLTALRLIYEILTVEQNHNEKSDYQIESEEEKTEKGTPEMIKRKVAETGMIWSAYRPGGERCYYNYHIPSQMSAIISLNYLVDIFRDLYSDQDAAEDVMDLQEEIEKGIQTHGIVEHPEFGEIYVYETDGLGNQVLMDDSSFPNLLSIPHFGYAPLEDTVYQNTRRFILSSENSNYIQGKSVSGLGETKKGKSLISPISFIMQALSTEDPLELDRILEMIKQSHGGTYQMQNWVDPEDTAKIISGKSDLANALFLELGLTKLVGLY